MIVPISKIESVMLFFLVVGSLTGASIYIFIEQLQFFRIALITSFIFVLYSFHFKEIVVDYRFKLLWVYFFISFIEAIFVSIFTEKFDVNSFVNYCFINLLLSVLIYYASCDPHKFLRILYFASSVMFVVMLMVASWELASGNHLPVSSVETKGGKHYIPTAFFCNQNDFLAMTTLIVLFLLYYNKSQEKSSSAIVIVFAQLNVLLAFIAESRINMLVSVLVICIYLTSKKNYIYIILALPIFFFGALFFFNENNIDIGSVLLSHEFKVDNDSAITRKELYKLAFMSIGGNYGFGYGLNNSSLFYSSQYDNLLMGAINPHNYLLEILINNGLLVFFMYIILNIYVSISFINSRQYLLFFYIMLYYIILMSSSSSIFLWYHYVFIVSLISFGVIKEKSDMDKFLEKTTLSLYE